MFLARFADGRDPKGFWEGQYLPCLQIPRTALQKIYGCSPVHVAALDALPRSGRILDAGCGLGVLPMLDDAAASERRFAGFDCSQDLIGKARLLAPKTELAVGELDAIPFPDAAFDAYVSISSLEFSLRGLLPALREARRVLKPGGKLWIACLRIPPEAHLLRRTIILSTSGRLVLEPCDQVVDPFPADGYGYYYRSSELARAVEAAGFQRVRARRSDFLGGLCYSKLPGDLVRERLSAWMGRTVFASDDTPIFRFARSVLLQERARHAVDLALDLARSAYSFWNVVEAERDV
jgi:ubiquinone/menaquinone biosynthesis C-methylase UbiE